MIIKAVTGVAAIPLLRRFYIVIKIYTDGACSGNPGPGGWSYIICKDEEIIQMSGGTTGKTTNNRMELMAVVKALEKILEIKEEKNMIAFQILSDSAYVINAINKRWVGYWKSNDWKTSKGEDVKNSDLWKQLLELKNKCEKQMKFLIFKKVEGHAGNYFNEWVDSMARNEVINQIRGVQK